MRLLLDTHVFAWALARSERLPAEVLDRVTDPETEVWVSAVTVYELDYKRPLDPETAILPADLAAAGVRLGYGWLDVSTEHARVAAGLDRRHKDPWDRFIAAQALTENLVLVTRDPAMAAFGVKVMW